MNTNINKSLVKLSLISMLVIGASSTLANPHNEKQKDSTDQEETTTSEMSSRLCPYEPNCPVPTLIELEDDQ